MMERKPGANVAAILRTAMVVVLLGGQIALMFAVSLYLNELGIVFTLVVDIVSAIVLLSLVSKHDDASFKIAWVLIVMLMPIFGLLLYLAWGRAPMSARTRRFVARVFTSARAQLPNNAQQGVKLERRHPIAARASAYLTKQGFPAYENTKVDYYALGEQAFEALYADLERAERFIFLEFFIVNYGEVWNRVFAILSRKAAQGVKVRLLYDDAGCLFTLKSDFAKQVREAGIEVAAFGKVHRYLSELRINYRNHQKIVVIDGDVGYTGGINLADEYANLFPKHGHWKDTALRLEGEAVWSLTITFISMWDLAHQSLTADYALYMPTCKTQGEGFSQPVDDGPENNPLNPIEDLYRHLINSARRYCYITTPYLVIDSGMFDALRMASRSGVDVRIFTPKKPDHWYVHLVTRSFYGQLLREGVSIYEYTPGFIHAKMLVADDEAALVGTVNMDFRSFYLHYENTVLTVGNQTVLDVRDDIRAMNPLCEEITLEIWRARPWYARALGFMLRMFATLM